MDTQVAVITRASAGSGGRPLAGLATRVQRPVDRTQRESPADVAEHRREQLVAPATFRAQLLGGSCFHLRRVRDAGDCDNGPVGFHGAPRLEAQMSDQQIPPDREDYLYDAVPGVHPAHGIFDDQARGFSPQLWVTTHRRVVAGAAAASAAAVTLLRRR